MQSSVEHVQVDNLQAVPPVQQPNDLLIFTPMPQIKVHYIITKLNFSHILVGYFLYVLLKLWRNEQRLQFCWPHQAAAHYM